MHATVDTLFLQDSEVLDIALIESAHPGLPSVRIRLSAASVRRQVDGGPAQWGFLKPLWIELEGARVQGRIADGVGRIGEGTLRVGGHDGAPPCQNQAMPLRAVRLPWTTEQPVTLGLSFRMGGEVRIEARRARCAPGPDTRFFEALAC